jgi:membrane fusion protein (multidrug efflux system)
MPQFVSRVSTPIPFAFTSHRTLLLLLSASALLLAGCGKSDSATGPANMPPPEVSFVTLEARALPVEMEYTGQTAGSRETEVRARVAGILQNRLYEEGSVVKAGAPLFQIDPATFQNQLASAEAAVAVATAKFNQAHRDHVRLSPLVADKAISQKEFDDSTSALEAAEASLKQAQAQANEARLNLGYTKVVSPISGTTGTAAKSEGNLITASDSLLTTIVQTNPIYVNFSVSEADMLQMTKQVSNGQLKVPGSRASNGSLGFTVNVKLADGSKFPRKGKLNFASEKVNPQTGSFDVRAEIPNPDGTLRPGQFVRVLLDGASRTNSLSVPQRAVIDSPFGKMVFVIDKDDKLEPRPVELDGWSNGQWIVTKGVKSGDRVLVEGFIKAHDPGMVVKPVPYVPVAPGANGSVAGGSAPPAPPTSAAPAASSPAAATSAASK